MQKRLAAFAAALAFSAVLIMPISASASALTSTQISAIIGLLQSFGADSSTIANVQVALGGSPSFVSCSSFGDLKYGNFDIAPGGRVSQLQTFLGIPSNSFGFGTYGLKTLAAWNSKCGTTPITSSFTATPTSGTSPLSVYFSFTPVTQADIHDTITFGDGSPQVDTSASCGGLVGQHCSTSHSYTTPGTYAAKLHSSSGPAVGQCNGLVNPDCDVIAQTTITVTSTQSATLTATPTYGSAPLTVTFSAPAIPADANYSYTVMSGDGGSATMTRVGFEQVSMQGAYIYNQAGTYTAQLVKQFSCGALSPAAGSPPCFPPAPQVVASANVTVTGGNSVPTITLNVSPSAINMGGNSILSWSASNAAYCSGSGFSTGSLATGSAQMSGSVTVSPQTTTTYSITCGNAGGTATQSVTITVTNTTSCPLYMPIACPAGQHAVSDAPTYDSNQCVVPHSHCELASSGLKVGFPVRPTTGVYVHSNPAASSLPVVATVHPSDSGVIVDGPVSASSFTWWKVKWASGIVGWSVEQENGQALLLQLAAVSAN